MRELTSLWAYSPTNRKKGEDYPSPTGETVIHPSNGMLLVGEYTGIENDYIVLEPCKRFPILSTPKTKKEYLYALACLKQDKRLGHNTLLNTSLPVAMKLTSEIVERLNPKAFNIDIRNPVWVLVTEVLGYDMKITNLKGDKTDTISSALWGWG